MQSGDEQHFDPLTHNNLLYIKIRKNRFLKKAVISVFTSCLPTIPQKSDQKRFMIIIALSSDFLIPFSKPDILPFKIIAGLFFF